MRESYEPPRDLVGGEFSLDRESVRGRAVYDLVYNPAETEFLRCARLRGCAAVGGLGMLVGQAALAFELWLGVAPPRAAMRSAAEAELVRRRG